MSDREPFDEQGPHHTGGSDAFGGQTYGGPPAAAQAPTPPAEPAAPYGAYSAQPPGNYPPPLAGDYPPPPLAGYPPPPPPYGGSILPSGGGGGADLLSSGPIEKPRRNVAAIVLSLVAVLAVIAAGVAYVGYHKLASKGSQPDRWAPANVAAYLKLDLDPSASEKISALQFEQKFPSAPRVTDAAKLKDTLLDAAFNKQSSDKINYAADVKPWLGSRVALAVYPDSAGGIQVIGILQVKDAATATAGLAKLVKEAAKNGSGLPLPPLDAGSSPAPVASPDDSIQSTSTVPGYHVEGDYAIVGKSQSAVDEAVTAAKKSNINSNSTYTADVATLKGDRVLTAWADLGTLAKLADSSGALGGAGMLVPGGLSGLAGNALKGRAVAGLRLQPNYAELEGRLLGADTSSYKNGKAGAMLKALPAGSIAGVSISGFGDAAKTGLAAMEQSPLVAGGLKNELDTIGSELGIALPDDVLNLLGNEFAASLDTVPSGGDPTSVKFTAITEPTDPAKGLDTATKLASLAGKAGFPFTASAKGSQVVLTNDKNAASGTLGDDPGFRAAMSGMPDQVLVAAYVNLAAIWVAAPASVPKDVKHLDGVGTYEGVAGNDVVFAVRLTVH
jgi:hypothetical protein